jgi:hypothetical protein
MGCKKRPFGSKELKHGKQATINRFQTKGAVALRINRKRKLEITPVHTQIGCSTLQNLDSTAVADSSYQTQEQQLREEQKRKLCLLEQLSTGIFPSSERQKVWSKDLSLTLSWTRTDTSRLALVT